MAKKVTKKKVDVREYLEGVCHLEQVSYREFYRTIFPVGALEERHERREDYEDGKYTGIIVEVTDEKREDGKTKVLRHTLTDDLDKLDEVTLRDNFCLLAPISYAGKSRHSHNARFIYAIAIDMDGIETKKNLNGLFNQIEKNQFFIDGGVFWGVPMPTYLVSSGTGLHLYYVLDEPIPLYPNIVKELEKLKKRITWQIWTQGATELPDDVQYESLFQGFRMVGTTAKKDKTKKGTRATAYKYGEKVTLDYLNESVPEEYRADLSRKLSRMTLKEAKKKYPEWYDKRIIKQVPRGTWICKRDLYDWWLRRIREVQQGHRYWGVFVLAVYAKKCAIPYDELVSDAINLIPFLDSIGKDDPFTKSDVMKAVEAYNDGYMTYPIDAIVTRTGIFIQRNKRNGRTREKHLQGARAIRDINNENWREGNGRPKGSGTKKLTVFRWRQRHPEGRKADCVRDTGLTKPTVYKWWGEASPINFQEADRERFISLQQQLRQEISQMTPRKMPASDKEKQALKKQIQKNINKRSVALVKEAFGDAWWKYTVMFWDSPTAVEDQTRSSGKE